MDWRESKVVKVCVRIFGLVSATLGFALKEEIALACFGAYIVLELWMTIDKLHGAAAEMREMSQEVSSAAENFNSKLSRDGAYEHLEAPALIWSRAEKILGTAQEKDEIWSTASTPNLPSFEEAVFRKVLSGGVEYKRLICYTEPGEQAYDARGFPALEVKGISTDEFLASYADWYTKFFETWKKHLETGQDREIECVGMRIWHEALQMLEQRGSHRFEVLSHGATLPSDYFIFNPFKGDTTWEAVVGFPRHEGEGMRSGFYTSYSPLAKDLGQNWKRLWEQARRVGNVHSRERAASSARS